MKQLKIGNVLLENSYVLGPMAGVTDLPFRLLCKEQGAGLLCMEMVSAKGIFYNNKNTESLLQIQPRGSTGIAAVFWFGSEDRQRDGETGRGTSVFHSGYQHGMSGAKGRAKRRRVCTDEESEAGIRTGQCDGKSNQKAGYR